MTTQMTRKERELYQSDASYHATIRELLRRVQASVKLEYYDCEDIGNKNTECTLGLCDGSIERMQDGVYTSKGHVCPHDRRYFTEEGELIPIEGGRDLSGCFYSCRIFKTKTKGDRQNITKRIEAVAASLPKEVSDAKI
jgi:hypothetical protein